MLLSRGGVSRCDANSGMDWQILDGILKLVVDRRGLKMSSFEANLRHGLADFGCFCGKCCLRATGRLAVMPILTWIGRFWMTF